MTKTLAEIYLQQGHLQDAYEIYRTLSEQDPSNIEIQKRLNELKKNLGLSSSPIQPSPRSTEEKIDLLEGWLANIRERKKRK